MSLTDQDLDEAVAAWKEYAEESPRRIDSRDVIVKRDLNMYRGLGIRSARDLAEALTEDRSRATLEMTMGHLYERVVEALGPRKVTLAEKKTEGFRGLDFVHDLPRELRLINLKAGLSTSNADISTATLANLERAKKFWEDRPARDDNPLRQAVRSVIVVRGVARGPSKTETISGGIRWLVGDAFWDFLGAGNDLLPRLGRALNRSPLDYEKLRSERARTSMRVLIHLQTAGFVTEGGGVRWDELLTAFP